MKLVTYNDGRVGELVDGQVLELDVPDMRRYFELDRPGGANRSRDVRSRT